MTSENIITKINDIKRIGKIYSNCYISFASFPKQEWKTYTSEKTIIISAFEGGINRIYFYTIDFVDFGKLIKLIIEDHTIEIISKNKSEFVSELKQAGYVRLACLKRVSVKDITPYVDRKIYLSDRNICEYALEGDVAEITSFLDKNFDTRISHLSDINTLKNAIANRECYLVREKNKIVSYVQIKKTTKSLYINQIINEGKKDRFHSLVSKIINSYTCDGGKYVYAWVDENNIASLKFFSKYGLEEDGLYTSIYLRYVK